MVSVLLRTRFSVFGKIKIGFSDLLFDAVRWFSGFSSENMRLNESSLILLAIFGFDRNLVRFRGLYGVVVSYLLHCPPS